MILLAGVDLSISPPLQFEFCRPPVVTSVFPSLVNTHTVSLVSVIGSGFTKTGMVVQFGQKANSSELSILSSTVMLCTTPNLKTRGELSIAVSGNDGYDFVNTGKYLTYEASATVEALIPSTGAPEQSGQLVTVIGKHFAASETQLCKFGSNTTMQSRRVTSTAVVCPIPAHSPGTVAVSVSNGLNHAIGQSTFRFASKTFTLITPSKGPLHGGTQVTISSLDFSLQNKYIVCGFGQNSVTGQVIENSAAVCVSPHGNGNVAFSVSQDGQQFAAERTVFAYYEDPFISAVTPCLGFGLGGTVVTVVGSSFGTDDLRCRFGLQTVSAEAVSGRTSTMIL